MKNICTLLLAILLFASPVVAADGPVLARRHMAATANPLATAAALAILRDGGAAVDAAIVAQMMLGVVEPQSSGIGGGSLLLVWNAAARELSFYEGLASAPADMPEDFAHQPDGRAIDARLLAHSGRVVGVPGTLRTLAAVHAAQGRLPWARLFADAIAAAEGGFAMPRYLRKTLGEHPELARNPAFAGYFGPGGTPLAIGATLRNPALAATYRRIAREGAEAFYAGPIAVAVAAAVQQGELPGRVTAADLAAWQPHRRAPVCLQAFAHRVCSAGPPSAGGIALLQELAMLDRLHIADTAPDSLLAAHLLIDAARLAEADRRVFIGDPGQVAVPVAGLLDSSYLDRRAAEISPGHALEQAGPGQLPERHAAASDPVALPATTHVSIVDDAGNAVAFTTTINENFGAEILVEGVLLNDGLTNFAARPVVAGVRVANAAAPGKIPLTTMAPTIVFGADGNPVLVVGAGGGARIIDSVVQTIVGVLAWRLDVRAAIEQPRIGGQNRAQELERNTPAAALADALRALGHAPKTVEMNAGVQAISIGSDGLRGWADPRRDGVAAGD